MLIGLVWRLICFSLFILRSDEVANDGNTGYPLNFLWLYYFTIFNTQNTEDGVVTVNDSQPSSKTALTYHVGYPLGTTSKVVSFRNDPVSTIPVVHI